MLGWPVIYSVEHTHRRKAKRRKERRLLLLVEMGRAPCCDKGSVKKGPWSPEEDRKLKEYIHKHGTGGNWIALPTKAGMYVYVRSL